MLTLSRLKVLKDEIRKPYFIKLKKFLYEQGVKSVGDSAPSLRVYPARMSPHCHFSLNLADSYIPSRSEKHLFMVQSYASGSCEGGYYRSRPLSWGGSSSW